MRRYLADGLNMGPHFRGWSTRSRRKALYLGAGLTSAAPDTSLASAAAADLAASDPSPEPPIGHDAPRSAHAASGGGAGHGGAPMSVPSYPEKPVASTTPAASTAAPSATPRVKEGLWLPVGGGCPGGGEKRLLTAETYYAQQLPIKAAPAPPEVSAGVCSHGAFIFDGAGAEHTGV